MARRELSPHVEVFSRRAFPAAPHPHVVVQDDVFNHSRIVGRRVRFDVEFAAGNRAGQRAARRGEGNLTKRSVVVVSQISAVEKCQLGERISSLSRERVDQFVAGLRFQQASFFERHTA